MASFADVRPRDRGQAAANFMLKTVAAVTAALERAVFSEEHARLPGLLQGRDPRAKVVATLLLLLAVGLAHHLVVVAALYAIVLLLARLSYLSFDFFVKRVWLGIPLFAAMIALPALFTLPGQPLLVLVDSGTIHVAVTDNGLASASLFLARVGTSASLAVLLVLTTRWAQLLKALRVLRVPEAFVIVLGMTYRYLFLFLYLANNMFLARQSRTVGPTSGAAQRRWAAATAGALFSRSMKMSGDVHQAMLARGFSGELRALADFHMADGDWLLIAAGLLVSAGLLMLDRGLV